MSSEQDLSNAIDAYLGKSAMPLPKGHPMRRGDADSWGEIKRSLRQAGEAIGVVKPKSEESSDVQKAKPKVLKPGSPEHTKAMAEMEATKAAKPKSTNPAGEESPSRAGSRERFGDRPLVNFDKQTQMASKKDISGVGGAVRGVKDKLAGGGGYMDPPVGYRAGRAAGTMAQAGGQAAGAAAGAAKRAFSAKNPKGYTGVGSDPKPAPPASNDFFPAEGRLKPKASGSRDKQGRPITKGIKKPQAHDILADGKPRHWARMGKVPGTEASPVLNTEEKKKVGEAFRNWPGNPKMPNNKGGDPGTRVAGITDHLDKSMDLEEGSRSWSYQG